jgi:hypothetical protein
MRPTVIPQALDGQPFKIAEARALGLSPKTLQGARFRRLAKGVYVVVARTAVGLIRERVDSPRETWLRLSLVLAGLPTPECNLIIRDDRGPIGRVDLVYLAYQLVIEYEGDQHRTDRGQ